MRSVYTSALLKRFIAHTRVFVGIKQCFESFRVDCVCLCFSAQKFSSRVPRPYWLSSRFSVRARDRDQLESAQRTFSTKVLLFIVPSSRLCVSVENSVNLFFFKSRPPVSEKNYFRVNGTHNEPFGSASSLCSGRLKIFRCIIICTFNSVLQLL